MIIIGISCDHEFKLITNEKNYFIIDLRYSIE